MGLYYTLILTSGSLKTMPDLASLPWPRIQTVLLDMDGTLLDLHFDNHFWREYLPQRYAATRGLDIPTAKRVLEPRFRNRAGTLDWYCVDYWTRELGLDISLLKREVADFIAVKPGALQFLERLRQAGKRSVLVTNAHPKSLGLKLERTRLGGYLDSILSAHEFGSPKEDVAFWGKLQRRESFHPERTLLIDDNLAVLRSARQFGIAHLLAVRKPSSRDPEVPRAEFAALEDFATLDPAAC